MVRKKTPPAYGDSAYREIVSTLIDVLGVRDGDVVQGASASDHVSKVGVELVIRLMVKSCGKLTGPIIVACQWN